MNKLKIMKILVNSMYVIGVVIFIGLALVYIWGVNFIPNPEVMWPLTLRIFTSICAAIGAFPLIGISIAFYNLNNIKERTDQKLYKAIIFFQELFVAGAFTSY